MERKARMGIFSKLKRNSKPVTLNIEKTNTLDGVGYDEENQRLIMFLSDGMDWHDEARHLFLLQEKINNYIAYIETKQYLKSYTNVKQIEIQICFCFKETDNCIKFLKQVEKLISESLKNTFITIEHGTEDTFPEEKQ